jgi:hypothetical protein
MASTLKRRTKTKYKELENTRVERRERERRKNIIVVSL